MHTLFGHDGEEEDKPCMRKRDDREQDIDYACRNI